MRRKGERRSRPIAIERSTSLFKDLAGLLADRYTIARELGGGGMSRVFAAREVGLNREVVIKVLSADIAAGVSVERFEREIQLAASLQHANIVPLLSAGNVAGLPYYTMPFVQGESLRARLSKEPPLSVREAVRVLHDVARALSYAHARGVVHRDIKPDNVLLSHGVAVVTDFGIAKAVSASQTLAPGATLTQAGTSIGTPTYMAPEQVAGDPNVDHHADLYSWGCMAYELLSGAPPFVSDSPQRLLVAHLSEAPVPIGDKRTDLPPALARLVMRCLAKEPTARPTGADELLNELEAVSTPGNSSPVASIRGPGFLSRPRQLAAAALVIAVLAVASLWIWQGRGARGGVGSPDLSLAVLPLANLSGDPADDYFGIGLAEEMTRALAKAGLRVIGRVSAAALQSRGLDERAIAQELGVGSLLTGSVQRAGGQLRISVTLSAADGAVRWSQAYDRPMANIFAVQDEIAREVARELLGTLGVGAAGTLVRAETADPEAHALVLQGVVLWNRRTESAIRQAIGLFAQAAVRDPEYARAQALIAMANASLPWYSAENTDSLLHRAQTAADRATAIDSTVAEAHAAAGMSLMLQGKSREADVRFRQALALDSTNATSWHWYGLLALRAGDIRESRRRAERAVALEPLSLIARASFMLTPMAERRFAEAEESARHIIGLDSSFSLGWIVLAEVRHSQRHVDEALEIMAQRVVGKAGVRSVEVDGIYAWMLASAGRDAEARAVIARLRGSDGGALPPVAALAAALEELGEGDEAVRVLRAAIDAHDPWLSIRARWARFDRLRKDPRGAALFAEHEAWR